MTKESWREIGREEQKNYNKENNEQNANSKSYLSIISLNVHGLNLPIKRYRVTVYIKNKI